MLRNAIFMAFDDRYWQYARACLNSLICNYPTHPEVLVFYNGMDPVVLRYLDALPRTLRLNSKTLRINTNGFPLAPVNNPIIYSRYALWTDRFDDYTNILHLDVDTLVLRDLTPIFASDDCFINTNEKLITNKSHLFIPTSDDSATLFRCLRDDGLEYDSLSYAVVNAGVFMLPKRYRNNQNFDELLSITRRYGKWLLYADQSAISIWCKLRDIKPQERHEYNYRVCFFAAEARKKRLDDIYILHFTGHKPDTVSFKHWQELGSMCVSLRELFCFYANLNQYARLYPALSTV